MKKVSSWTKDFLDQEKIPFYFKQQATSSNDLAKDQAFKKKQRLSVFLVGHQTKGRGYNNKIWQNSDLQISFLWKQNFSDIPLKACEDFAKDLKQALKKAWPQLDFKVKPPNDLYLEGGKLAGLLLEALKQGSQTALIVGLGLNVFSAPKNLNAAYLAKKTQDINLKTWQTFLQNLVCCWSQRIKTL